MFTLSMWVLEQKTPLPEALNTHPPPQVLTFVSRFSTQCQKVCSQVQNQFSNYYSQLQEFWNPALSAEHGCLIC